MAIEKRYRELEKALKEKYKNIRENEVTLDGDDFKKGKLTIEGYERLKNQCDYIPYSEEIEIIVPCEHEKGFRESLEFMAVHELSRIRQDRRDARVAAMVLMLGGIVTFLFGVLLEHAGRGLFEYIFVIASWVFVWAAVEKWFFDRKELHEKRRSLLQILSAKITVK